MDAQFQVPQIPLVTNNLVDKKIEIKRKISTKSNGPLSQAKSIAQQATNNVTEQKQSRKLNQTIVQNSDNKSSKKQSKSIIDNLLPVRTLPKLCPSCSQVLIDYLTPLENYIKQIINLADNSHRSVPSDSIPALLQNSQFEPTKEGELSSQLNNVSLNDKQNWASSRENNTGGGDKSNSAPFWSHDQIVSSTLNKPIEINQEYNSDVSPGNEHSFKNVPGTSQSGQINDIQSSNTQVESSLRHNQTNQWLNSTESNYRNDQNRAQEQIYIQSEVIKEAQFDSQLISETISQNVQPSHSITPTQGQQNAIDMGEFNQSFSEESTVNEQSKVESFTNESHIRGRSTNAQEKIFTKEENSSQPAHWFEKNPISNLEDNWQSTEEVSSDSCPYAYVTIAYNNLSAMNAILLVNSIQLYNNKVLNVLENDDLLSKKITIRYHIPTVILICDNINNELRNIIYQVFDKVIESKYQDAVLLNDESLGIQQYKIHLWKELAFQYEKCIFLEAFTMVVGQVSNLFLECHELSACVDCLFPDNFDCSVFVFEPNMDTYKELLKYGLQLKINEGNEDAFEFDTLDEMTLLNQFFAFKWKKLSFIYNFVRNDLTYTQVPAYFKYGDNIRVVNFGNITGQHLFYSSHQPNLDKFSSPLQPWNFKFDLSKVPLEEEPFHNAQVDNYCKFYLRCFIRRVWPLLSQTITPYLLSQHNGRTEWTIFELIQILGRGSGTESIAFEQNPVSMRRKKSWVAEHKLRPIETDHDQKENEEINDSTNLSDQDQAKLVENVETSQEEKDDRTAEYNSEDVVQPSSLVNDTGKRQWEDGRVDWMGQHQSDKIINRLKTIIHK